jgi:hypothetical protein
MKNIIRTLLITVIFICIFKYDYADKWRGPLKKTSNANKQVAEGCLAASSFIELDINDVRARINTGGDMWWDLQGNAQYFIPKNTTKTSMFSGALWIGGLDVNGQLKLAAQKYRQSGIDYWTGPVKTDGTASVDAATCTEYDKQWVITRNDVAEFIAAYKEDPSLTNYVVPTCVKDYPAHGDWENGYPRYLAPFFDKNQDGVYRYQDGDYPYYDFENKLCPKYLPCGTPRERTAEGNGYLVDQVLKGDRTIWWIFNDKGGIHTETGGAPIGMEVRAQAFGFATNDEVNRMTFYSYEIINRSTYRLTETYMSQWVDTDLGFAEDDYVGCDVLRGLGYCYNGKDPDGQGQPQSYGSQPPAIGVDFFQGPYMDPDGKDDPKYDNNGKLICGPGINGVNFANCIVDDERYGMRRFVYHNNTGNGIWATQDPDLAAEYYNLLKGIWKDGSKMRWGGNGHINNGGTGPACDFMFPCTSSGNTDPCDWGTNGVVPTNDPIWTEANVDNDAWDRRFMQSAGPFTLEPGAVNYVTVGIPWARATTGGPWASVELLRQVDDKCQTLFDNCFKLIDGPDAPELVAQELDKEIILYISNRKNLSNNYKNYPEDYAERDPNIVFNDTVQFANRGDSCYRFEGYQVFQLSDASVGVTDLKNADKARLVAQCDIINFDKETGFPIGKLVNYYFDENLGGNTPVLEVDGANAGITHSFRVLEDKFATNDKRLVNHKQYYFMAISYSFNRYAKYDPNDPRMLDGQKKPYLAGRKSATGSIKAITVIPHNPSPESGGTMINADYGVQPKITRIEGQGNGGLNLDLTKASIDKILSNDPDKFTLEYMYNKGPVNIKVVDPLSVVGANYSLKFIPKLRGTTLVMDSASWILTNNDNGQSWSSERTIATQNEQIIPQIGLSLMITQSLYPGDPKSLRNGFIEATIEYADSTKKWLSGVPNINRSTDMAYNWIRSGVFADINSQDRNDYDLKYDINGTITGTALDPNEDYEKLLYGTWSPYRLASKYADGPALNNTVAQTWNPLSRLASVDIIITSDRSKWTRCPVIEMNEDVNVALAEGNVKKFKLRAGSTDGVQGMGWFPGYAINIETGERLNMMFGEDSRLISENGRDMLWNPTSNYLTRLGQITQSVPGAQVDEGEILFGGKHWTYVVAHNADRIQSGELVDCPAYDGGEWLRNMLMKSDASFQRYIFKDMMWVSCPMVSEPKYSFTDPANIPCDVKMRIRVIRPYARYFSTAKDSAANPLNGNWPLYTFNTTNIATLTGSATVAQGALEMINIVPNPYYGFSTYEKNQVENRVRITNLPEKCTITIYSVNGSQIRQFSKDDPLTYLDWDLKNFAAIPISGGIYLVHIKADGVGEKVLKWFAAMRPIDLNAF